MNANTNFYQCSYRATLNNRFFNEIFKQGCLKKSVEKKKKKKKKATNKIIVNDTHQKELNYWKKVVLEGKNEKRRSKGSS